MSFTPSPRRTLSPGEKAAVIQRQNNLCAECGEPLSGRIEFDHRLPLALGGDNSLTNFEALHVRPCHLARTRVTVGMKSKADRQGGGRGSQWKRRKEGKTRGFFAWLNMKGEVVRKKDRERG